MDKKCSKCESIMVEARLDNDPIRVYKAAAKPNAKTMSNMNSCFVANCGFN